MKIFTLGRKTNILKKKQCVQISDLCFEFVFAFEIQLACPKKPVSPRFNAAWKPKGNIFPSVESFYGSLVLLCGTKSHNDLSTTISNIIMTVKMFLMIRAGSEGIDFKLKMKMKSY